MLWDLAETICLQKTRNKGGEFSSDTGQDLPQANTTHPPTTTALQTTKITKLGLLPPPIGFQQKFYNIRNEKQIYIFSSRETIPDRWDWNLIS